MTKLELCGRCADWKDVGAVAGVIGRCRNAESIYLGYVFAYGRVSCSWWKCPACFDPYCGLDEEQAAAVKAERDRDLAERFPGGVMQAAETGYKASVLEEAAPEMEPAPWQVSGKPARVHMSQVSADEPAPVFIGEGTFPHVLAAGQVLADLIRDRSGWWRRSGGSGSAALTKALEVWDRATGQYEGPKRP